MAGSGDFKIGDGYVEVHLKDSTEADAKKLQRKLDGASSTIKAKLDPSAAERDMKQLGQRLKRKGTTLPVGVKIQDVGPELQRLRQQIRDMKLEAKPKVVWEEREFVDAYGNTYKRYVKASKDAGTFASEALSGTMYKGLATMVRAPGLFAPVLAAAGSLVTAGAILAIPAKFAQIGMQIQGTNADVAQSFTGLQKDITSALQVDSAPMAGTLIASTQQIGAAFQALRPQMRDIFTEIPGQMETLTSGVTRFASNAMPGLVTAVRSAGPVVSGLADGLASAGTGVTRFFTAASTGAPGAGQSLRSVGVIASDVGEMLGRLAGSMGTAFGPVLQTAEGAFSKLTGTVGNFATSALPPLGSGMEAAVNVFGAALSVIQPFSGMIGSVAGTVLGATVAIRGLSAAFGVLAAGKVLTMFAPMKSAFTTLSTQVATTGANFAGWTTKVTGSAAAGEKVAAVSNKITSGFRAVGNSLPIVGAALVGIAVAWEEVSSKADSAAASVLSGSQTFQNAVNAERNQIEKNNNVLFESMSAHEMDAQARANVTGEIEKQLSSMGPLARAQAEVALAAGKYQDALRDSGPGTQAAATASAALSAAQDRLAAAQHQAEQATKSTTQALIEQTGIMQGSVDAEFAYSDAVKATAEAQKAAAAAVKQHGAGSKEAVAAVDALARAMNDQATAAGKAAEAAYAGMDPQMQASKAAEAYRTELLRTAAASGPAGQAFASIASKMNTAELDALSATAAASGLRTELVTLPDGRQVRIVVEADRGKLDQLNDDFRNLDNKIVNISISGQAQQELAGVKGAFDAVPGEKTITVKSMSFEAQAQLRALGLTVTTLPDGQVQVTVEDEAARARFNALMTTLSTAQAAPKVDLNTATAEQKAGALKAHIDGLVGIATADANAAPGTQKANDLKAHIDGITALMKADADISPGTAAGAELQNHINGLVGIMTADANNAPGTAKGDALRSYIDGLLAIMEADANTQPGTAKGNALKAYIDGLRAAITANVNDAAAKAALARLTQSRTMTITAIVRQRALPPGHTASGGGVFSGGGVQGFAGGGIAKASSSSGMVIPGYAPGIDDVPALVSRGESVLVPELTRALGAGRIMAANREASGGRPGTMVGSMAGMMDGTIGRRFSGGGLVKPGATAFAGGGTVDLTAGGSSYMMSQWMAATYKAAKLDPGSDKGKIAAAEKQIIDALRTEKAAWIALTQARKDAARALDELHEKVSDYALDAEDADIAVERATERMRAMLKDRGATDLDKREAINAWRQAVERQQDMQEEHASDLKALREADARGVEGSEVVLNAKDAVVVGKAGTSSAKVGLTTTKADIKKAAEDKKKADAEKKKADAEAKKSKSKSFDSGGLAHGIGVLPKRTIRPERVLSPQMTADFAELIPLVRGLRAERGRTGGNTINIHMTQPPESAGEAARLLTLALRGIG